MDQYKQVQTKSTLWVDKKNEEIDREIDRWNAKGIVLKVGDGYNKTNYCV